MNTTIRSLVTIGAFALATRLVPAQEETPTKEPTVPDLIQQLGARDYQARRAAESSLRGHGKDALEALRKAAGDDSDAEVQWRARRLVREIESGTDGRLQRRDAGPAAPGAPVAPGTRVQGWAPFGNDPDLEHLFGDMFEHLERDFGVDVPRGRFFQDDFFQGLQQQMEDLRRGTAMGLPGSGHAFNMRVGPDGVRIEVTEKDASGKEDTKVYEAPDVKTFREKYPQIAERYLQDGSGVRTFGFGGRLPGMLRVPSLAPRLLDPRLPDVDDQAPLPMGEAAVVDNGERLGVLVQAVPDAVREFLELQPGQGLSVEGVDAGSLAQTLGIAAGDVLLEVGGKSIGAPLDVRDALSGIAAGEKVTVKVNRRGQEQVFEAAKPAAPKPAATKKLEKRPAPTSIR